MSQILFDANQFFADPDLTSDGCEELLGFCWRNDWTLLISDVVLLEARGLFARKVDLALDRATTGRDDKREEGRRRLRGLLGSDNVDGVTAERAADAYFEAMKMRGPPFDAIERIGFPAVSHEFVADRCFRGARPYHKDAKKDGYRDTLIWVSLLEILEKDEREILHFVTSNWTDFFRDASHPPSLHDDLLHDLDLREISRDRLVCHDSIDSFLRGVARAHSETASRLSREVFEPRVFEFAAACLGEVQLGNRVLYEAGSSYDVMERVIQIDRPPTLVAAKVHAVYTPNGADFIARAFADIDIGAGEQRIHHIKFRLRWSAAKPDVSLDAGSGGSIQFGPGDSERQVATTAWSRPWW